MKYLVILADGAADYRIKKIGNKTPLMVAKKPTIDKITQLGRCGRLITLANDLPIGSDVANLAVLGYDPYANLNGRGVLEAANQGIALKDNDLTFRCNVICIENGLIKNHSAGHITTEESAQLIAFLNKELGSDKIKFYPGVSYRNLLVIEGGNVDVITYPPHDYVLKPFKEYLVKPKNDSREAREFAAFLNSMILKSQELLENHPVNLKRKAEKKDPANIIWPWSGGFKPKMRTFKQLFGLDGAVISAVDLINGIGVYAGFKVISVKGATGLYNTNYEGKADAAIEALKTVDFVYLHIEASDEAGHEGDLELKIKTIEYLDERLVKRIWNKKSELKDDLSIAILPDHCTPCEVRTHTIDPIPFVIYNPKVAPDKIATFDEFSVEKGSYGTLKGTDFMKAFLQKTPAPEIPRSLDACTV
jgi:2,3-bisphosphoglycerate-independent phosphoglycerate mutase